MPAAFFVSTADRLEFANGEDYVVNAVSPTLSVFDPKAYGFLQPGQQSIVVTGDLESNDGSNFTIVTKDLEVNGGSIGAGSTQSNIVVVADGDVTVGGNGQSVIAADDGGSIRIDANGSVSVNEGALISASSCLLYTSPSPRDS